MLVGLDGDYGIVGGGVSGEGGAVTPEEGDVSGLDGAGGGDAGKGGGGDAAKDGGADATKDGGVRFCDTQPNAFFCDDFEVVRGGPRFGWDDYEAEGGAPLVRDGVGADGTRGLIAEVRVSGRSGKVLLLKQLAAIPVGRTLTVSFSFRVVETTLDYAVLGAVSFPGFEYGLAQYDENGGCPEADAGTSCFEESNSTTPPNGHNRSMMIRNDGAWHRAKIIVTRQAATIEGDLEVDAMNIHERGAVELSAGSMQIRVGAFFTANDGRAEVHIDNVAMTQD